MSLVKRHVDVRAFKARGYLMGDYPTWLTLSRHAHVGYIPKVLCRYRVLEESASRSRCPLRRYRFAKSLDQIKLDFIQEYGLASRVVEKVMRDRHITLFYGGYALLLQDDFLEGYRWLVEHYPDEFGTRKQRLRAGLVRRPRLWKAVRQAENTWLGRRLLGEHMIAP
jgi:hypothetical protein